MKKAKSTTIIILTLLIIMTATVLLSSYKIAQACESTQSITVASSPQTGAGFVTVDGVAYSTPKTFSWETGSTHTLAATGTVGTSGTRYAYSSWSNGGAQTHSYTVPSSSATVTANYQTQYQLTISSNFGSVSPASGSWFNAGSKVTIYAISPSVVSGERYVWNGWTGSGSGSYSGSGNNSALVTMNAPVTESASWTHQYYLTVSSAYGTTSGSDWYVSGSTAYAGLGAGTVSGGAGTRYVFTSWSGDASGTNFAQSNVITMSSPKTATASWKTQYQLTFASSPSAGGSINQGNGYFDAGSLPITATPNNGYHFDHWSSASSITFGSTTSVSTTATIGSEGTITATFTQNDVTQFDVSGFPSSTTASAAHDVTVTAKDAYGNTITGYSGTVVFSSSDAQAVLPSSSTLTNGVGTFSVTLKTAGTQSITATDSVNSGITGSQNGITVSAADLDHIVISPVSPSIVAGGSQAFTAEAFDKYGNSLGDVTSSTTFTDPGATVTGNSVSATLVGSYTITATYGGKSDSTTLTVNAAGLDHIVISPKESTVAAGGSQAYSVEAFDVYGNSLGDVTASVAFSVNGVPITGNVVSETLVGSYTVTATYSGKSDTASLTVTANGNAGSFGWIVISPKSASITAGSSQAYSAEAFDQFGNSLGDVTAGTVFVCPGATVSGNSVSATVAGVYTVTASYNGKTADASLTVEAGVLDHITISPVSATVTAGVSQAYTATAADSYGNTWGVTGSVTWSIDAGAGGSWSGSTYTSANIGAWTVKAALGGVSGTAQLTVTGTTPGGVSGTSQMTVTAVSNTYTVTFTETGLPAKAPWNVTLNGVTQSSTTPNIVFHIASGSYSWSVQTPINNGTNMRYVTSKASGKVSVPSTTSVNVTYITQYYLTVKSIYGNPTGEGWYNASSKASFSVTSPATDDSGDQFDFAGWTGTGAGSYTGSENAQSVIMNCPITESADWTPVSTSLYTVVEAALILLALTLLIALLIAMRRRRQKKNGENANSTLASNL